MILDGATCDSAGDKPGHRTQEAGEDGGDLVREFAGRGEDEGEESGCAVDLRLFFSFLLREIRAFGWGERRGGGKGHYPLKYGQKVCQRLPRPCLRLYKCITIFTEQLRYGCFLNGGWRGEIEILD